MAQTGRQPYDTTEPTIFGVPSARIRPPPDLPERVKRAFLAIVSSCPASQFQQCDVELLTRWSEASVTAQEARVQLEATGLVGTDGKPSPWIAIYRQASRDQALWAMRLRIGPQARAPRAPKVSARKLSYYEEQALAEAEADGQGEESARTRDQSN
jgi:hypothetical protein